MNTDVQWSLGPKSITGMFEGFPAAPVTELRIQMLGSLGLDGLASKPVSGIYVKEVRL